MEGQEEPKACSEGSINKSNCISFKNTVTDFPTEYNSLRNIRI